MVKTRGGVVRGMGMHKISAKILLLDGTLAASSVGTFATERGLSRCYSQSMSTPRYLHRTTCRVREEAGLAAGERLWKRGKVTTEDLVGGRVMTSGKTSGSFTSSALTVRGGGLVA